MEEKFDGRPRTGSCLCGGIRFRIKEGSKDVVMCHCVFCRRSVTSVGAYVRCDPADLILLFGRPKWYRSSPTARRGFCSKCGSQLFWEPTHGAHVAVSAGSLDQSDGLRVTEHIYADQRPAFERLDTAEPALVQDEE